VASEAIAALHIRADVCRASQQKKKDERDINVALWQRDSSSSSRGTVCKTDDSRRTDIWPLGDISQRFRQYPQSNSMANISPSGWVIVLLDMTLYVDRTWPFGSICSPDKSFHAEIRRSRGRDYCWDQHASHVHQLF